MNYLINREIEKIAIEMVVNPEYIEMSEIF